MSKHKTIDLNFEEKSPEAMLASSRAFCNEICKRRTVREFSSLRVDEEVVLNAIKAAGSSPSGANKQPWHFVLVSDPTIKKQIRSAAEKEEQEFYSRRAPDAWLEDLEQLGTDASKPFLEEAPFLIAVFLEKYEIAEDGSKHKNYYMPESVGIATGILITALHLSGLATLTHTPSPMAFLNQILKRPENEKPFLLLVTGLPLDETKVPDIKRKALETIVTKF